MPRLSRTATRRWHAFRVELARRLCIALRTDTYRHTEQEWAQIISALIAGPQGREIIRGAATVMLPPRYAQRLRSIFFRVTVDPFGRLKSVSATVCVRKERSNEPA